MNRAALRVSLALCVSFCLTLLAGCDVAPEREFQDIRKILESAPVAALADIGAGDGDHLPLYSSYVGADGAVHATELDPELVAGLRKRVTTEKLANVSVHQASATSTGLPDACCDVIVLRHVYHHLSNPDETLRDIDRALKPRGRLLVIDFRPTPLLAPWTPDDLPGDRSGHGVTPELISREAGAAGFALRSVDKDWPGGHLLLDRFAVLLEKG